MKTLIVLWKDVQVGTLTFDGTYYTFEYIKEYNFQPLMNFPDLNRTYQSNELFAFFANQVMSPYRPDYESQKIYLNH